MSIFDQSVTPDYYLEHMKQTLEWINEKRAEVEELQRKEPNNPRDARMFRGYNCAITVDADWLRQLVLELIGKHQIILEAQKRAQRELSYLAMTRPVVFPSAEEKKGEKS